MSKSSGSCKTLLLIVVGFFIVGALAFFKVSSYQHLLSLASGLRPAPRGLRLGITDSPSALPFYALERLSQGDEEKTEIIKLKDGGALWQMLESGELDGAVVGLDQAAKASRRFEFGSLAFPVADSSSAYAIVSAKKSPASKSDSSGASFVGCLVGTSSEYLALSYIMQGAENNSNLHLAPAASYEELAKELRNGNLQYAAVAQPVLGELLSQGFKKEESWKNKDNLLQVFVVSRKAGADATKVAELNKLARNWFNTVERLETAPGFIYKAISDNTGLSKQQTEVALKNIEFYNKSLAVAITTTQGQDYQERVARFADNWSLAGTYLKQENNASLDPKRIIAFTILNIGDFSEPDSNSEASQGQTPETTSGQPQAGQAQEPNSLNPASPGQDLSGNQEVPQGQSEDTGNQPSEPSAGDEVILQDPTSPDQPVEGGANLGAPGSIQFKGRNSTVRNRGQNSRALSPGNNQPGSTEQAQPPLDSNVTNDTSDLRTIPLGPPDQQ